MNGITFAPGMLQRTLEAAAMLACGLLLARLAAAAVRRVVQRRSNAQQADVVRRTVFYGIVGLTVAGVLNHFGVDLSVLLGAAGVLTVALGFAAQTSASNLISGLFLLGERPFVVGDMIQVGAGSTGQVMSIDLLSVKLRTVDNLSVRVPNETLLKSELTNFTRYPIRRVDLDVTIVYGADLERARALLLAVASTHQLVLDEPRPQAFLRRLGEWGVEMQLLFWARSENVLDARDAVLASALEALGDAGLQHPAELRLAALPRP
jgi:small-conductance mechanosensitive channel